MNRALEDVEIVVPTVGRPSLPVLLGSIAASDGPRPRAITLIDDRPDAAHPLPLGGSLGWLAGRLRTLRGAAAGPASARNVGWRMSDARWIAYLDDDVIVTEGWLEDLARDLGALDAHVAAVQGSIAVPLVAERRPTDWERNVAGLERARWATADMAYRCDVLAEVGGFDERFGHAYREDAELALRVLDRGYSLVRGRRVVLHPVRPATSTVSIRLQRGNADDMLMWALHGRGWRARAGAPRGRFLGHLATVAGAGVALAGAATGRRAVGLAGAGVWLGATAELATARVRPGPKIPREIATMLFTSIALPFAAVAHAGRGAVTLRRQLRDPVHAPHPHWPALHDEPYAVLLDRDGTIVDDVPYNDDPELVSPACGAASALERLRHAGLRLAVVSNQSGVARGRLTRADVDAVNTRVEALLGPLGPFFVCPHGESDGCACRKPAPGLVLEAARRLGVPPARCVVIGDTGADVDAARAAGARAILVPNGQTRVEEIEAAPEVAHDLAAAVDIVLASRDARLHARDANCFRRAAYAAEHVLSAR